MEPINEKIKLYLSLRDLQKNIVVPPYTPAFEQDMVNFVNQDIYIFKIYIWLWKIYAFKHGRRVAEVIFIYKDEINMLRLACFLYKDLELDLINPLPAFIKNWNLYQFLINKLKNFILFHTF